MSFDHIENEELQGRFIIPQYYKLIQKVRKICKSFRKSSVKNENFLQKCMIESHGKEISLKLDMKVRWNSTKEMLEIFLKVRCIFCSHCL